MAVKLGAWKGLRWEAWKKLGNKKSLAKLCAAWNGFKACKSFLNQTFHVASLKSLCRSQLLIEKERHAACFHATTKRFQSDSMNPEAPKWSFWKLRFEASGSSILELLEASFWSFWKLHFGASWESLEALKWSFQASIFRSFKIELPASKLSFSISSFSKRASRKARPSSYPPRLPTFLQPSRTPAPATYFATCWNPCACHAKHTLNVKKRPETVSF